MNVLLTPLLDTAQNLWLASGIILLTAACTYIGYTYGHEMGVKLGRREGVDERHELVLKLADLERLGATLKTQLDDQHAALTAADFVGPAAVQTVQTAPYASGADLPASFQSSASPADGSDLSPDVAVDLPAELQNARTAEQVLGWDEPVQLVFAAQTPEEDTQNALDESLLEKRDRVLEQIRDHDARVAERANQWDRDPDWSAPGFGTHGEAPAAPESEPAEPVQPVQTERVEDPAKPGSDGYEF